MNIPIICANTIVSNCLNVSGHRNHPDAKPLDADLAKIAKEKLGFGSVDGIQVVDDLRSRELSKSWGFRFCGRFSSPVIAVHKGLESCAPQARRFQILSELALSSGNYYLVEMVREVAGGIFATTILFSGGVTVLAFGKLFLYALINEQAKKIAHTFFVKQAERWAIKEFTQEQIGEIKIAYAVAKRCFITDVIDELKEESEQRYFCLSRMKEAAASLKIGECTFSKSLLNDGNGEGDSLFKMMRSHIVCNEMSSLVNQLVPAGEGREKLLQQVTKLRLKLLTDSDVKFEMDQIEISMLTQFHFSSLKQIEKNLIEMKPSMAEGVQTEISEIASYLTSIKPDLSNFDNAALSEKLQAVLDHWPKAYQTTHNSLSALFKNTPAAPTGLDLPFKFRPPRQESTPFYQAREDYHSQVYQQNHTYYQFTSLAATLTLVWRVRSLLRELNPALFLMALSTVTKVVDPLMARVCYYLYDRHFVNTTKETPPTSIHPKVWRGAINLLK